MDSNSINILIQCGTLLVTIILGIWGLLIWKKQIKYKEEREVASETIALIYEIKEIIATIRSPFSYEYESEITEKNVYENEDEEKAYAQYRVVSNRYKKFYEKFVKFNSIKYKYITLIKKEDLQLFSQVSNIISDIHNEAQLLGMCSISLQRRSSMTHEELKAINEEMTGYRKTIYWQGKEDKIDKQIEEIIKKFEITCSKLLK